MSTVPFDGRTSLSLKLLLVESPATLEVMFLNDGIAFLIYIYPAMFPQQTLKTEEMVKSATLMSLSSRDKNCQNFFYLGFRSAVD